MKTIIGIDVGGSTTKIVGFNFNTNGEKNLIPPLFVRATDPITSVYGAFGKFTLLNGLSLSDIDKVLMTGVGSSFINEPIYSLNCSPVPEFSCIGLGGLYLSGLDDAIVVSMGTGTALIHAKRTNGKTSTEYLGGTGIGGGTILGLSRKMLGVDTIEHIEQLCADGDLSKIDLHVKDLTKTNIYKSSMNENLTASNFGNLSDLANKNDISLGIVNMVAETIAMMAIFAARNFSIKNIVLTGNLTGIEPIRKIFDNLKAVFDVNFIIPENAQFGTVIGAALSDLN